MTALGAGAIIGARRHIEGVLMRRSLVTLLVTAVAALGTVGSPAAAPPNFTAAESLCTAGGYFFASFGPTQYSCSSFSGDFLQRNITPARALCENAYGGLFRIIPPGANFYVCFLD